MYGRSDVMAADTWPQQPESMGGGGVWPRSSEPGSSGSRVGSAVWSCTRDRHSVISSTQNPLHRT